MASLDRPKLRALSARRVEHQGRPFVALEDSLGLFTGPFLIPLDGFIHIVRHFDGATTLDEIRAKFRSGTGLDITSGELADFVDRLDRAMVLDGPKFSGFAENYAKAEVHPSVLAGRSYPANEASLRAELARFFDHPAGSGHPAIGSSKTSAKFRGILSPHIDFRRGGPTYSWAYRELVERSDADVFVILGVAHQYCKHRFALTRKDFQTPLGTARIDRAFVDRVTEIAGGHLFEDELAHRTEHSIEFQVVFLQYLLGMSRDCTIVPILVGSFHDLMMSGAEPRDHPEVRSMIDALRSAEADSGKEVAYIGGIDLCHVGPEFGDPQPVDDATLGQVRSFDEVMLDRASARDASGWFARAAEVENRWRVCGLAATYVMLETIGPAKGRILRYDQAVNPTRSCCVTFASVAFDAEVPTTDE